MGEVVHLATQQEEMRAMGAAQMALAITTVTTLQQSIETLYHLVSQVQRALVEAQEKTARYDA